MFVHKKICLPTDQLIESKVRVLLAHSQENCTLCDSNLLMSQDNNYKISGMQNLHNSSRNMTELG